MALDSMQEIFDKIQAGRKPFWQVVRDTDVEERQVTAEASFEKMHATWRAMVESVDTPACTGSWRHPRRGPAACCRLCWCRCTAGAL